MDFLWIWVFFPAFFLPKDLNKALGGEKDLIALTTLESKLKIVDFKPTGSFLDSHKDWKITHNMIESFLLLLFFFFVEVIVVLISNNDDNTKEWVVNGCC